MSTTAASTLRFTAAAVTARITRITDPLGVLSYLVLGDRHTVLVDTGYGVGDFAGAVRELTPLPVTVLLTHGHLDHAFGASWFDDVRIHPADLPVLREHSALAREVHDEIEGSGAPTAAIPTPERLGAAQPGEVLDLGGVTVEVHAAAGHTPGSIALLVPEERVLITGDAANQRTFLFLPESLPLPVFRRGIAALEVATAGRYDRVLTSHGDGEAPLDLLSQLDVLCARILSGEDDAEPFEFKGMHGRVARRLPADVLADADANIVYDPDRLAEPGR